jgi:dihydroflavonol-4-reductase
MHFVDVRDAARALVRALTHPAPRPVYHLPGHASSIAGFFAEVAEIGAVRGPRLVLPVGVALALARLLQPFHLLPEPAAVAMASHWWGLSSRYAGADLGHAPRPARETLADTIADLRAAGDPTAVRAPARE